MNPPGLGFICCLVLGIVLLCPAIALLLPSAGLVALLAGMWLELLGKRNMHVAGLWIAMQKSQRYTQSSVPRSRQLWSAAC